MMSPPENGFYSRILSTKNCSRVTDRKSTRLNSSHSQISYAVFCLKKKKNHKFFGSRLLLLEYKCTHLRTCLASRKFSHIKCRLIVDFSRIRMIRLLPSNITNTSEF